MSLLGNCYCFQDNLRRHFTNEECRGRTLRHRCPLFRSAPFRILGPFLPFFPHPSIQCKCDPGYFWRPSSAVGVGKVGKTRCPMMAAKTPSFPRIPRFRFGRKKSPFRCRTPFSSSPALLWLGRRAGMPREFALFCALKRASHENTTQFLLPSLPSLSLPLPAHRSVSAPLRLSPFSAPDSYNFRTMASCHRRAPL